MMTVLLLELRFSRAELRLFCFCDVVWLFFFSFSAPNLRGRSVDRHHILTHVRWYWLPEFIKWGQKFGAPSQKFGDPKTSEFGIDFGKLRKYLRSGTAYRPTVKGFAKNANNNRPISCACVLNLVNLGIRCDRKRLKDRTGVSGGPTQCARITWIRFCTVSTSLFMIPLIRWVKLTAYILVVDNELPFTLRNARLLRQTVPRYLSVSCRPIGLQTQT